MKIAIISLTVGGYELSLNLIKFCSDAVLFAKYPDNRQSVVKIEGNFKNLVKDIFSSFDGLIFIMSTGIVVRTIAPLLINKLEDPAVIVMDEKGENVISLLSGHIGGANELAVEIAKNLGSNPVITTSSDVNNKIAIDVFAKKNNLIIEDMKDATSIAAIIVNNGKIYFERDESINFSDSFIRENKNLFEKNGNEDGIVIISNKEIQKNKSSLVLIPKNIVIGLGCRKGIGFELIKRAVFKALKCNNLNKKSIKHIATVDVKKDEVGIIEMAAFLEIPLIIIDREKIKTVEEQYKGSDFVKSQIGVSAVCEPCAKLSSNIEGKFLMNKTSFGGITIAIWEENYEIR